MTQFYKWTIAVILAILPTAILNADSGKIRHARSKVPNQYIVVLADDVPTDQVAAVAAQLTQAHNAELVEVWTSAVRGFYAKMTPNFAEAMSHRKEVKYIEENALMFLSASQKTNINPTTCDPTTNPNCPTVLDNRLWHLDRADQTTADPTNSYNYCTDGSGITVYVVDTGVYKFHNEFTGPPNRVQTGFNSSGDNMPANDPCMGLALPPTGFYYLLEEEKYGLEINGAGHGTAVASVLGGKRIGIAKNVTIVPIKTSRCDLDSARNRISAHSYSQNETIFRPNAQGTIDAIYRATNGGTTAGTDPYGTFDWPKNDYNQVQDGGVLWEVVPSADVNNRQTVQMIVSGLNWILSPANPGPKSYAIVTLSTWRPPNEPGVAGLEEDTLESVVRNLLANNLTVIASANNQNGNACDTSPARLSIGNPGSDPNLKKDVITVGGSMLLNRPWAVDISDTSGTEADGDGVGLEPAFYWKDGVRDGRWICGLGDSTPCHNTPANCAGFSDLSKCTVNPATLAYLGFAGGSNGGPCVTLFTPAKNLSLATNAGANQYRDGRINKQYASGTSWSAPIAAGFAARVMQASGNLTPAQMRTALLNNSGADLDPASLNTYDYLGNLIMGTPNKLLHLSDVNITAHPQSTQAAPSGPTQLSVTANGTSTVFYQWYEVVLADGGNPGFDIATYKRGAHPPQASTLIAGATLSSYNAEASSSLRAYWVRVTNSCGSADSDIAVVVPRPGAPSNLSVNPTGASVTVTWSAGSGVEQYQVERKVADQVWTTAGTVGSNTFSFVETPTAPGGMVVYRVRATAGSLYLPPQALAQSDPSNNDFANLNAAAYEALATPPSYTTIKAQHLIELRQAVNNLCDAVGAPREYLASEDLLLSSLQGAPVQAAHFTSLMAKANSIRTNSLLAVGAASFTQTPDVDVPVAGSHLQNLRDALK